MMQDIAECYKKIYIRLSNLRMHFIKTGEYYYKTAVTLSNLLIKVTAVFSYFAMRSDSHSIMYLYGNNVSKPFKGTYLSFKYRIFSQCFLSFNDQIKAKITGIFLQYIIIYYKIYYYTHHSQQYKKHICSPLLESVY